MSRFRTRYAGRARNNEFHQFENVFFASPAPLARIAERDKRQRQQMRDKARLAKLAGFDY